MASYSQLVYGVGFTTNQESNDYLRCLWSCIRNEFGKMAWYIAPEKIGDKRYIYIGLADIGLGASESIAVDISYGKRGCLKSVKIGNIKDKTTYERLESCLKKARNYPDLWIKKYLKVSLDSQIDFTLVRTEEFLLKGNELTLSLRCFDNQDAKFMYLTLVQTICSILSFYTLVPVVLPDSCPGLIYGNIIHIDVPEQAVRHITDLLNRDYTYEENETLLENAMYVFMQGLIMERMSYQSTVHSFSYTENAIINYMSSLEVITVHDTAPVRCETCGQMRYSIAKRVKDLAATTEPEFAEKISGWISDFYKKRSAFVHTGKRLSSNNYAGVSTPLISNYNSDGIIDQYSTVSSSLKYEVRNMILFHEGLPKMGYD